MVNRFDYTISAGNLNIRPMFKHLFLRDHSSVLEDATGDGSIRSFSIYAPIVRTRFDLTAKSNLQLGFQGFLSGGTPVWTGWTRATISRNGRWC